MASLLVSPAAWADDNNHGTTEPSITPLDLGEYVPGAAALEGRVIAPCCWNQTIDIHGSEPSTALRREIRTRLKAGETPAAIEASLVQRYGAKIMAVSQGSRLGGTGILLATAMGAAGVGAVFLLRRWRKRGRAGQVAEQAKPSPRDALDERLDAELSRLD